jgi:hypothetical protein
VCFYFSFRQHLKDTKYAQIQWLADLWWVSHQLDDNDLLRSSISRNAEVMWLVQPSTSSIIGPS